MTHGDLVELVDLSVPIESGMPICPGDPTVTIRPALRVADDGVNVLTVHMGSQSGTHVDAPYHIDDSLPRLDELPLDRFIGPTAVMDARGLPPRTAIGPELLPAGIRPGMILLVATGWSAHWGQDAYLTHPYLDPRTAMALVDLDVRAVGIDALSVDATPEPGGQFMLPSHRLLCGASIVIAENLTGLNQVLRAQEAGRTIETSLLPIRLAGSDGAPIRAVARLGPAS